MNSKIERPFKYKLTKLYRTITKRNDEEPEFGM